MFPHISAFKHSRCSLSSTLRASRTEPYCAITKPQPILALATWFCHASKVRGGDRLISRPFPVDIECQGRLYEKTTKLASILFYSYRTFGRLCFSILQYSHLKQKSSAYTSSLHNSLGLALQRLKEIGIGRFFREHLSANIEAPFIRVKFPFDVTFIHATPKPKLVTVFAKSEFADWYSKGFVYFLRKLRAPWC